MQLSKMELIVYLAGNAFRIYTISLLYSIMLERTENKKVRMMRELEYSLFFCINSGTFIIGKCSPTVIFITNIVGTIVISATYKGSWSRRIGVVISSAALYTICEDSVYYILALLSVKHIVAIGIVTANILFFMIVQLIKISKADMIISLEDWVISIIIPVLSLFISMVILDECRNESSVAIGGLSLIVINVLMFFMMDHIQSMYQQQMNISLLKQQNKAYEEQMSILKLSEERLHALQHDLKNHLLAIERISTMNDRNAMETYMDDLFSEAEASSMFAETGNYIIDAFLNSKLANAKNLGVNVETDLKISRELNMPPTDISIILGNLLDNAVEASTKCRKRKAIKIVMREDCGKLYLRMINTYQGKIRVYRGMILSNKPNRGNHGIGLKNVQEVVDKYHGEMNTSYTEDYFSVAIIIFL